MADKYLNKTGLSYLFDRLKTIFAQKSELPTKTSDLTNDSNYVSDASYVHTDVNFTETLKNKLDAIAEGATNVTVDSALSGTSENPVENKAVKSALDLKATIDSPALTGTPTVPTATAGSAGSQIANTEFVSTAITNALADVTSIKFEMVTALPSEGANGTIYLISNGGSNPNIYDEFIFVNNAWEKIGTTDVDLSAYWNQDNLLAITTGEIDDLFDAE